MPVVTRFAPSPTGFLHIGGVRTALFNWLYARHHGGRFLLRIEDTDRARSTEAAVEAILDGLRWLGLEWDGEAVSQFSRADVHAEAARQLLAEGKAYRCYCTPEELAEMRRQAREQGLSWRYDGRWRDRDPAEAPSGIEPAIRLKAPREGETTIDDLVQGEVRVANRELDDMVLLRADGTPTYMLAVVIDDHDMGISHVIRGDDHLSNAFRQSQLYHALGWQPPAFAHIPLIHGADGAKLSKRHGALGVEAYREAGYLPEAMVNYLLRLGWGHGDDEVIDRNQAIGWFDLDGVGRAPARFDAAKLTSLNGHYLRQGDDRRLAGLVAPRLEERLGRPLDETGRERLVKAMEGLKQRSKTIVELSDSAWFYVAQRPIELDPKASRILDHEGRRQLSALAPVLRAVAAWDRGTLETVVRAHAEGLDSPPVKLGKVAQPLRAALTGSTASPPIFEAMEILGKQETIDRLDDLLETS